MEEESNTLLDGSLIDLCGAVLLWRSAEALKEMAVCYSFPLSFLLYFSSALFTNSVRKH